MMDSTLLDAAGHRRSRATMPGYHEGRAPRNKGLTYPADPLTIEEIVRYCELPVTRQTAHASGH